MLFKNLDEVIRIIIFQTGLKEEAIAKKIDRSRSHMNVLKKAGLGEDYALLLNIAFKKEIEQFVRKYSNLNGYEQPFNSKAPGEGLGTPGDQIESDLQAIDAAVNRIREKQRAAQDATVNNESLRIGTDTATGAGKRSKGKRGPS